MRNDIDGIILCWSSLYAETSNKNEYFINFNKHEDIRGRKSIQIKRKPIQRSSLFETQFEFKGKYFSRKHGFACLFSLAHNNTISC